MKIDIILLIFSPRIEVNYGIFLCKKSKKVYNTLEAIVKGNYSKIIQIVLDNSVFSLSNVFLNDLTTLLFTKLLR